MMMMATTTTVLLLWWAGVSWARVIRKDAPDLVVAMAAYDRRWAPLLNVNVLVNTSLVTPAAMSVLRQLGALTATDQPAAAVTGSPPQSPKSTPAWPLSPKSSSTSVKKKIGGADSATTTTVNALAVVVDVASGDWHESEAFDFALAVAGSALKCAVLPFVLAQVYAIDSTLQFQIAANFDRPTVVWATLARYLNKLARMRESLRTGAQMYRMWETVVRQTLPPGPTNQFGVMGDTKPFRNLVEDAVRAACVPGTMEAVYARFEGAGNPTEWDSAEVTAAVFDGSQEALMMVLDNIPISTVDDSVWREYLDGPAAT